MEQLSLKVVEASPDAKVGINSLGVVIIFNQQAELMFGYARDSVLGQLIEMLLDESVRDVHVEYRSRYFDSPGVREMGAGRALLARHRNGTTFTVQIKLAPLIVPAGVHALAVVRRVVAPRPLEGGV